MPLPAIVIAESFEHGTLGDFLRSSNCPGLTYVYPAGNGIFVADPHSGSQAAKLSNGLGDMGLGLAPSSVQLDAPLGATEVGYFFKIAAPNPLSTGAMVMAQIGWKPVGSGAGSTEYVQMNFVYDAPGLLHLFGSVGGFDHAYTLVPDTWYEYNIQDTGAWRLSLPSGLVASGLLDPLPSERVLYVAVTGENHGLNTVDDFYYRPAPPPPPAIPPGVRQYPRDDALGLGSAPRLYPPPRRNRVVGGYQ